MTLLRALWRLLYFAVYTTLRIGQIVLASLLFGQDIPRALRIRQRWANHLLPFIGVRATITGRPPDFPCILMANHRSYLDPVLLVRWVLAYAVSKAEVARWPIIGYGTRVAGVLHLQRESADSRRITLQGIAEKVRAGYPVILFPEGTTQTGPATLALRPGGFRLAAENDIPIVPVALDYADPADYWVGSDGFIGHFLRRFGQRRIRVILHFGPTLQHSDAEELLRQTQTWIDAELVIIRQQF